jgi:hypothetical protein
MTMLFQGFQSGPKKSRNPVRCHARNAVTGLNEKHRLRRRLQYARNFDNKFTDMTCLRCNLAARTYYRPTDQGFEQRLRARLDELLIRVHLQHTMAKKLVVPAAPRTNLTSSGQATQDRTPLHGACALRVVPAAKLASRFTSAAFDSDDLARLDELKASEASGH